MNKAYKFKDQTKPYFVTFTIVNNPVDAEIVNNTEDYVFRSAIDYTGHKGLINVELLL